MMMQRPVALVTGSTSGIGAAIARRLSRDGYAVILHSRSSVATGQAMACELAEARYIQADLAVEADRSRLIREAVAVWGRLDVLVNNAGVAPTVRLDILETTEESFERLLRINLEEGDSIETVTQARLAGGASLEEEQTFRSASLGEESVNGPDGEVTAQKLTLAIESDSLNNVVDRAWFAPQVGFVKLDPAGSDVGEVTLKSVEILEGDAKCVAL